MRNKNLNTEQEEMARLFDVVIGYGWHPDSACNLSLKELREVVVKAEETKKQKMTRGEEIAF